MPGFSTRFSGADGAAGGAQDGQHRADNDQDDADRPQDRNAEHETQDQHNDAQDDHGGSLQSLTANGATLPWPHGHADACGHSMIGSGYTRDNAVGQTLQFRYPRIAGSRAVAVWVLHAVPNRGRGARRRIAANPMDHRPHL
jgi:hypothetical protein